MRLITLHYAGMGTSLPYVYAVSSFPSMFTSCMNKSYKNAVQNWKHMRN